MAKRQHDHAENLGQPSPELSDAIRDRFESFGNQASPQEAIEALRNSLAATASGDPRRGVVLVNLGLALQVLFERTGQVDVLAEAVEIGRRAVEATASDHPERAGRLNNLGLALRALS